MATSILHPTTCGFARIAAFNAFTDANIERKATENRKEYISKKHLYQYRLFQKQFQGLTKFDVPYNIFVPKFKRIVNNVRYIGKQSPSSKDHILTGFAAKRWSELKDCEKQKHSLTNCNGCLHDYQFKCLLGLFPYQSKSFKTLAKQNGILNKKEHVLHDITNELVQKLDKEYKKNFQTTFSEVHANIYNLEYKSKEEKNKENKKEKRLIVKSTVHDIENQWKETSVVR